MPPRPKAKTRAQKSGLRYDVNVRIDAETRRRLRKAAAQEDRSESALVRRALTCYLEGGPGQRANGELGGFVTLRVGGRAAFRLRYLADTDELVLLDESDEILYSQEVGS